MKRGMEKNMSWDNAAIQYEQVFEWAFIDPPYAGWVKYKHEKETQLQLVKNLHIFATLFAIKFALPY